MDFTIVWVSVIFFVLYLSFIGLFFLGFKYFKKLLGEEATNKEKTDDPNSR